MAASVTPNLTLIDNANTETGWSGTQGNLDTEIKVQGTGSYTYQTSKNSRSSCTFTPAAAIDMSATDTHLYFWMRCDVMPFCEPKTTGTTTPSGLTIRLTSTTNNYIEWHVAGSDTWGGEWRCFVVDINNTSEIYASAGTLDRSSVTVFEWFTDNSNSGNIRIIDNTWIDVVRFGTGLTITGTSFDFTDIAAIDEDSANKYGILQNINGVIFSQGRITIGSGATTTTFSSDNETLVFKDGFVSSNLYQLNFVGSGNTSDISNTVFKSSGTTDNARFILDADDTNITFTMDGCSLTRAGLISFADGDTITNNVFNNCGTVDPTTATFQNNTITNYGGTNGGLVTDQVSNISDCNFISNTRACVIEDVTFGSAYEFDNLTFTGNTYDVHLNNGGITIDVNLLNGSDASTYIATGGGVVTFRTSITITIHVENEAGTDIQSALVYLDDNDTVPFILNTTTDVDGEATGNYTGAGGTAIIRVRKYGYKYYKSSVSLANDINLNVTLIADPQQT